jgi:hypothetical protein
MSYLNVVSFDHGDYALLGTLEQLFKKNKKIDFNSIDEKTEKNGLHFCVENVNVNSFSWLKDKGVSLSLQDFEGNTPIHSILKKINKDFMDINIEENTIMLNKALENPSEIDFQIKNLRGETLFELSKNITYIGKIINDSFQKKNKILEEINQKNINNKIKEKNFELDLSDEFSFL